MKARMSDGTTADIKAVWFENGKVRMIDQRELPLKLVIVDFEDYLDVAEAIRNMTTRGAPCIGASAAYAMCLAGLKKVDLDEAAKNIKAARPTAYDLFYATDWMYDRLKAGDDPNVAALADLLLFLDDYSGTVREFLKLNAMQAAATVNGAGKENEDNFYSRCLSRREGDQSAVVSDEEPTPISDPQVFAVLEGEDGPEATTIAAGVLDEMYPEIPEDSGETPEYLHRACAAINQRVCQHNDENFSGSRASLAMLLVQDYRAWACNVGHSVVVRVRDRKAEVLSVDDSTDSLGSSMRTQLTQYLGMRDEEMVLEPHVREIDFAAGDCFLVASSSLYHALPAERVVAACSGDGTEEEKLRALIDEATKEHPSEDMTGIVIGIAQ